MCIEKFHNGMNEGQKFKFKYDCRVFTFVQYIYYSSSFLQSKTLIAKLLYLLRMTVDGSLFSFNMLYK